jgi:CDP-diglyceride synthetase
VSTHPASIIQSLALIGAANYAPILIKKLLGRTLNRPIDGGLVLSDGHPFLGSSKTWRGLAGAVLASTCASIIVGLEWKVGALVGAVAMVGDCLSSFAKRRLGVKPGEMFIGLDQVPESLLPALICHLYLPLNAVDVAVVLLLFIAAQIVFSRILFTLGLRDRPY